MNTRKHRLLIVLVAAVLCFAVVGVGYAINLGSLFKVGGVALLVTQFGPDINKTINKTLGERGAAVAGATKVVPILSIGAGTYIGAAQVVGNPDNVRQVKAVFQIEGRFGSFRPTVYIPAAVQRSAGTPERAKGVGVSAVVQFRI